MATRSRLSRVGRVTLAVTVSAATTAAIGLLGPAAGYAAPAAHTTSISSVKARVDALNARLDRAVEDYDKAKVELASAQRAAARAQSRITATQRQLTVLRARISELAAAAYRGASGGGSVVATFVGATDPQQFVDRATTLDELDRDQAAELQSVTTAEHDLTVAEQTAASQLATARALANKISDRKGYIERTLHVQQALLHRLQAQQASLAPAPTSVSYSYHGPASGAARVAVEWAYRELGKPYVWAAAGPDSFDCSGLTMYVWGKAGVSLPHSAEMQYSSGPHIARTDLAPGDLVFFGSPIGHVGIYVGNGNMIEAPHSGAVVRVSSIDRPDYVGAARP